MRPTNRKPWIDPNTLAGAYFNARRFDDATPFLERSLELNPDHIWALWLRAIVALQHGEIDRARELAERWRAADGSTHLLAQVLGAAGHPDSAKIVLRDEIARRGGAGMNAFLARWTAYVYVTLGDYDQALDWLERPANQLGSGALSLRVWPGFDPIRDRPRFRALVDQMAYPE